MSTPRYIDTVACLNDVAIRYINYLLEQHAEDQHMLANQKPSDERVLERLTEIRAKNTELEMINRALKERLMKYEPAAQAPQPMVPDAMGQPVYADACAQAKAPPEPNWYQARGIGVQFTEPDKYPAPGAAMVNEALHRMTTQGINPLTHDEQKEYRRLSEKILGISKL